MNTLTKNVIRIWIALTSFFAFAIGWIALSHAETPTTLATQTTEPATTTISGVEFSPVPSLKDLVSGQPSNAPGFTINVTTPQLRTMGS